MEAQEEDTAGGGALAPFRELRDPLPRDAEQPTDQLKACACLVCAVDRCGELHAGSLEILLAHADRSRGVGHCL